MKFGGQISKSEGRVFANFFFNYIRSHSAKNQNSRMLRADVSYMAIFTAISAGDNGKLIFF